MKPTKGMDRGQLHDKAWALWQAKALDDAKLPKLSIYAIRTLWDVLFDSMPSQPVEAGEAFQTRVQPWLMECFGPMIAGDREERNHRFFEEAAELVQACGMTASEAHQLVDYTFGRPIGEPSQEVGGVMVTLAALCLANGLDMHAAGETELARINVPETVAKIRAKQAAKPKHSPLPAAPAQSGEPDGWLVRGEKTYLYIDSPSKPGFVLINSGDTVLSVEPRYAAPQPSPTAVVPYRAASDCQYVGASEEAKCAWADGWNQCAQFTKGSHDGY